MYIAAFLLSFAFTVPAASSPASRPALAASDSASAATAPANLSPYEEEIAPIQELRAQVARMLQERDFEALDRLGERLLKERARFRSGSWKLSVYYETLANRQLSNPQLLTSQHVEKLKDWTVKRPQSPQALIALADAMIAWAQEARGDGAAQDITEEQAKQFVANLQEAGKHLDDAEAITRNDPELYCARMETVRGSALLSRLKESFDAGAAVDPEYYSLYRTMASLILPRWFGKPGDEVTFAEATALRTRDTEGNGLYARIAMYVSDYDNQEFSKRYIFSWKRVQKGFRDIEKRFPGSLVNLNRFARFACIIQNARVAKEYLDRLGEWEEGRLEHSLWGSRQAYARWRLWAAGQGPNPWGELLHGAARAGNLRVIKDLIRQKEDLNPRDLLGQTPLFIACKEGQEEAALLLIEAGADARAATDTNQTPLYQAAGMGLSRVVEKLISSHVSAGVSETHESWTPLHLASLHGHPQIARLLLDQPGVDAAAKTSDGKTPLHLAASRGQVEIGRILVQQAPGSVNARTAEGRTPLHYAANQGNPEFVRLLLGHGADPEARDNRQRRPLEYATLRKKPDAADLLRAATKTPVQTHTRPANK